MYIIHGVNLPPSQYKLGHKLAHLLLLDRSAQLECQELSHNPVKTQIKQKKFTEISSTGIRYFSRPKFQKSLLMMKDEVILVFFILYATLIAARLFQ